MALAVRGRIAARSQDARMRFSSRAVSRDVTPRIGRFSLLVMGGLLVKVGVFLRSTRAARARHGVFPNDPHGGRFSCNSPQYYARARHGVFPRGENTMKKPRCGARTRRGTPCQASAIWSARSQRFTRCRNHGGLSTGPKTAEGIERIRRAVTKHGRYAKRRESR
jgi:hypothetical protein